MKILGIILLMVLALALACFLLILLRYAARLEKERNDLEDDILDVWLNSKKH